MNGFNFIDFPNTSTPLNAENLNKATGTAIFTSGSYNLNNITDDYEAYFRGATVTNAPVNGYFWFKCLKGTNSSYASQIAITETTPTEMYFRKKSSSWDSWRKVDTIYELNRTSTVIENIDILRNNWGNISVGPFIIYIKGGSYGYNDMCYGYKTSDTYGAALSMRYTGSKEVYKKEYVLNNGTWAEKEYGGKIITKTGSKNITASDYHNDVNLDSITLEAGYSYLIFGAVNTTVSADIPLHCNIRNADISNIGYGNMMNGGSSLSIAYLDKKTSNVTVNLTHYVYYEGAYTINDRLFIIRI